MSFLLWKMSWERSKQTNVVDQNTFYLLADVHFVSFLFFSFRFHFLEMKRRKEREEKNTRCLQVYDDFEESSLTRSHGYWTEENVGERDDLQKRSREKKKKKTGEMEATGASWCERALKRGWKIISRNTPPYSIRLFWGVFFRISNSLLKSSLFLLDPSFFPLLFIYCFGS